MASKAYESYEMLAKLLNSNSQENIDRAYDALATALTASFDSQLQQNKKNYEDKRDKLAVNKAKADKYLDYFMTEKGYSGSGIEADAKLKAQLGYNSDLAALGAEESNKDAELRLKYEQQSASNEAERQSKKTAAGKEYADAVYKATVADAADELKQKQLELQEKELLQNRYLKEKEYEIKQLQAQTEAAKASAQTSEDKEQVKQLTSKLETYRQLLYQNIKQEFEATDDVDTMQRIYDSVSGVNAENAADIFGEKLYESMLKDFSKQLTKAKEEKADLDTVMRLYDQFVNATGEYFEETYTRLKKRLTGSFPGYTQDQLDRAAKMFKSNTLK